MKRYIYICTILVMCCAWFASCGAQSSTADDGGMISVDVITPEEATILEETEINESSDEIVLEETDPDESETIEENHRLVVIDAGHQQSGDFNKEPIGPGATETKAKVAGGTKGVVSGLKEYELTLAISLKLQAELVSRGYEVIMCRTENDVNISNSQRAQIANDANADVFIRIHANGSENSSVNGAMTICQKENNPYNGDLFESSYCLSECVLDSLVSSTGCKKEYIWKTNSMSGINWSRVPTTIVEVGYMTNPTEDQKLATEEYQSLIATGLADGIDIYFQEMEGEGDDN